MYWFWKLLIWIGCILYIISPIDILTDFLPIMGRIDDLIILITTIWVIKKYLPQYRYTTYQQKTTNENKKTDEDDEKDPYTILGVSRKATQDEIKKAYHELAAKYHPDKVNHLGDEFKELAHKKFVKIQEAYQKISRG